MEQNYYPNEFATRQICVSITRNDSKKDIQLADDLICAQLGRKMRYGKSSITEFVFEKFDERQIQEIQIAYSPSNGVMGWMADDREWYPAHGLEIISLEEFICKESAIAQDNFDDVF